MSRELHPLKLPEPLKEPKLKFGPRRKRALTGREIADQQEADEARARRKAEHLAKQQNKVDRDIEEEAQVRSQIQEEVAAAYITSQAPTSAKAPISDDSDCNSGNDSDSSYLSDPLVDLLEFTQAPANSTPTATATSSPSPSLPPERP